MLSIIIVNYKNEQKTIDYIETELCKVTTPHIVVVVNNEATEKSNHSLVKGLRAELVSDINLPLNKNKNYFVVPHPENLGFAKGNNLGAEFSIKHFDVDYFLFSNNDIRLIDLNVIEKLLEKISSLPNVGIIGPRVVGFDGKNQSPFPYAPFWNRYFWMYWLTPFITKEMKNKIFRLNYSEEASEGFHYRIMGSFFIARAKDFIDCGMMDTNTFLFAEEMILTERMYSIGQSIYYEPNVSILHDHNHTISKFIDQKKQYKIRFESESYYYKTYKGISKASIFIGRCSYGLYLEIIRIYNRFIKEVI